MTDSLALATAKKTRVAAPSKCLGLTFESDDARRQHFLERLRAELPELRKRPDFPKGEDEVILRMSDPPYYTACPNPFLAEFVEHYGKPYDPDDGYHREPFAVDVSVGKTDRLYKAHGYHTKVPHLAIVPSILHYTKPGDIVLDGFCGSGMTGVAAQWCGVAPAQYRKTLEAEWRKEGREPPEWGARRVVLGDLSPAATFIAANYNIPFDVAEFAEAAKKLLDDVEKEVGWMYETLHTDGETTGKINYTVWSEVFACPACAGEVVFSQSALDSATGRTQPTFPCSHCGAEQTKKTLVRSFDTTVDVATGEPWRHIKLRPVLIQYQVGANRYTKIPSDADIALIDQISQLPLPSEVPTTVFPIRQMYHGSRLAPKGFTRIHHIYSHRAASSMATLVRLCREQDDVRLASALLFFVEQGMVTMSILNRYRANQGSQSNQVLSGVYYIPSLIAETSPWYRLGRKTVDIPRAFGESPSGVEQASVATQSCTTLSAVPDQSVDYVFTDPPFGENIFYADQNIIVESWHKLVTSADMEAIVDRPKQKGMEEYQHLMAMSFKEYHRVLKPGRWITIVFHNSKNLIWVAIQEALAEGGFVVADVRSLDKKQKSFRQVTGATAVKQDLVISAYKPSRRLEKRFELLAGSEEGVWAFVRGHLENLPVFVAKSGVAEVVAERMDYLLFDRMVAFHVQRGVSIPLSAAEFYEGLKQRFAVRNGMHFLSEQAVEHDRKRLRVDRIEQLTLIVTDEKSAIQWLRAQLKARPRSFQAIHPDFVREISGWQKHEQLLELSALLEQNFLSYDGDGEVPSQIHAYLSSNHKPTRNLPKDDTFLREQAKDRWYVPDANKAADLEKLRDRSLLREFETYCDSSLRRLAKFRLEAVRAGFRRAWSQGDHDTILEIAGKIPYKVLREDIQLLMWYDQAKTRKEAEEG